MYVRLVAISCSTVIDDVIQAAYQWFNTSGNFAIYDSNITVLNPYVGGAYTSTRWTIWTDVV